jgi:hypothetical protein
MTIKYWRIKLEGAQPIEKVAGAISPGGATLLRVHVEKGETSVYFSAEKTAAAGITKAMTRTDKPEEVSPDEIVKL